MRKLKQKPKAKSLKQPTTNNQSLITNLSWLPNKVFELEFTIPWGNVKKYYDEGLKKVASQTTIKGFRKGKAPISLVEKNVDKAKIYQEVLKQLLPITYVEAIKKHNLRPIMSPKVQPVSTKENKDWQFKATSCEAPEVNLGDYQKQIKGELAKEKIWVPGKGKPNLADKPDSPNKPNKPSDPNKPNTADQSYDRKLRAVTTILLRSIEVNLPDILVEDEVNKMLSRFLDQVNKLGMTIDQYLASKNMSSDQLRAQYRKTAEDSLKMEFILAEIVNDRGIKVEKSEIDKMIQATPDEKTRKQLDAPEQRTYIAHILSKRKAIDFLLSL